MKLYYSPGACSLSPHIVLREAGIPFELDAVNLRTGQFHGHDFKETNPKGYVPTLGLDNGEILTEGAVIVQYIADLKPGANLIPPAGSMERYRCQEWLNYISTELHKGFGPLFHDSPEPAKKEAKEALAKRIGFVNEKLRGQKYLMGDQFTVADAYLFTVISWAAFVKLDISDFGEVNSFLERMRARPAVQEALKAESLK